MRQLLPSPLFLTGNAEKISWTPVPFTWAPRALKSCLILPSFCLIVSLVPTWPRSRDSSLPSTSCGSLPVTSQMVAPGKQQTSLNRISGQQMGASVPFSKESPTTSTRRFLSQLLGHGAAAVSPCESWSLVLSAARCPWGVCTPCSWWCVVLCAPSP